VAEVQAWRAVCAVQGELRNDLRCPTRRASVHGHCHDPRVCLLRRSGGPSAGKKPLSLMLIECVMQEWTRLGVQQHSVCTCDKIGLFHITGTVSLVVSADKAVTFEGSDSLMTLGRFVSHARHFLERRMPCARISFSASCTAGRVSGTRSLLCWSPSHPSCRLVGGFA
jgi:hypothetical protein